MGILTKKEKIKIAPRTEESKAGGKYLMDTLGKGTPDIPVRNVADLSPIQQLIQEKLGGMLSNADESSALARKTYTDILNNNDDITQGKEYRGLKSEAERLKKKGITDVRHSANRKGMFGSSPQFAGEGDVSAQYDSNLLTLLGQMEEREKDRKTDAAGNIQRLDSQNISNAAAIGGIAKEGQENEQMKSDALYSAALQQVMFPYTTMSNIAAQLLNVNNQAFMTGGGLSDLGVALSISSGAAGSYAGAQAGASS